MMTIEQPKFFEAVNAALAEYVKPPTVKELESWWASCRGFALSDVERALREHAFDADDGKRAPRPVDVRRRLEFGVQQGASCSATGAAGRCAYPGIFSDDTTGGKRWWCAWHRINRSGPEAERWIEVSLQVPYATALERRVARMTAEGQRAPGVVNIAHAIALRHGNAPWRREPQSFGDFLKAAGFPEINPDADDPPAEEVA